MQKMLEEDENYKIRFVNRLDMNTSGLLIVAKNSHAQDALTKQMNASARGLHKKYKAIVVGEMPEDSGTIDLPLGRPDPEEVERWVLPCLLYTSIDDWQHMEFQQAFQGVMEIYFFLRLLDVRRCDQ